MISGPLKLNFYSVVYTSLLGSILVSSIKLELFLLMSILYELIAKQFFLVLNVYANISCSGKKLLTQLHIYFTLNLFKSFRIHYIGVFWQQIN